MIGSEVHCLVCVFAQRTAISSYPFRLGVAVVYYFLHFAGYLLCFVTSGNQAATTNYVELHAVSF